MAVTTVLVLRESIILFAPKTIVNFRPSDLVMLSDIKWAFDLKIALPITYLAWVTSPLSLNVVCVFFLLFSS